MIPDPTNADFEGASRYPAERTQRAMFHVQVKLHVKDEAKVVSRQIVDCLMKRVKGNWLAVRVERIE